MAKQPQKDLSKPPDPNKHLKISLLKSTIRIAGYCALLYSLDIGATLLILSEVAGIGEELV